MGEYKFSVTVGTTVHLFRDGTSAAIFAGYHRALITAL